MFRYAATVRAFVGSDDQPLEEKGGRGHHQAQLGLRFLTRSRVFTDEEADALEGAN